MGGKLLNQIWNLSENRIPRVEFDRIVSEILGAIQSASPRRAESLRFFDEKQDFGDADILVEAVTGDSFDWRKFARELSGYEPHKNGNVLSFPYDNFQVDLIFAESEIFNCASNYYAMEVGNFQGRVADALGLSYGHRGLYLQVPLSYFEEGLPEHEYREVLISRNPIEIFALLGFDYPRFVKGFKDFYEMSYWVADSRYFSPQAFAFDALNSINRTRNRKRPVYAAFVEWCNSQPAREDIPPKEVFREWFIARWPAVASGIEQHRADIILNRERAAKFNGKQVISKLGLQGKDLGNYIKAFKAARSSNEREWVAWLDARSAEQINVEIV